WFGHKILLMTPEEEKAALKTDTLAETKPDTDTKMRSDTLSPGFDEARLGSLLLHELSHTGHKTNWMGSGDYQEGQSYAIEYFYAEKSRDQKRMDKILDIMRAGSVAMPALRDSLRTHFRWSYALMVSLQQLIKTGKAPYSTELNLTTDDAELLSAEFVTNFRSPSKKLQSVIDYVQGHLAAFRQPPL
ncbi:MAG TPA: hypothetical protein VIV60_29375, partial [Polyangiaceae bacterium]